MNIVSEYSYTLESIIQAEHKNLAIANITITTNKVQRPSRLYKNVPEYIKRSLATILRVYSMFNPLKIFLTLGAFCAFLGFLLGCRFLFYYLLGNAGGKIQSLILAAIMIVIGFQLVVVAVVSDLISANRRLLEDCLLRIKKIELKVRQLTKDFS
jgi:hypothetical protein